MLVKSRCPDTCQVFLVQTGESIQNPAGELIPRKLAERCQTCGNSRGKFRRTIEAKVGTTGQKSEVSHYESYLQCDAPRVSPEDVFMENLASPGVHFVKNDQLLPQPPTGQEVKPYDFCFSWVRRLRQR